MEVLAWAPQASLAVMPGWSGFLMGTNKGMDGPVQAKILRNPDLQQLPPAGRLLAGRTAIRAKADRNVRAPMCLRPAVAGAAAVGPWADWEGACG
jgi:hypothetical protein